MSIFDGGWPEAHRSRRARELGGVVDWAAVAEFAVGPHSVVLDPEVLDDDAGLGQRPHLLPIEWNDSTKPFSHGLAGVM